MALKVKLASMKHYKNEIPYPEQYIFHCFFIKKDLHSYTTLTNLCTKDLLMCKVYTDVGGIKVIQCLSTCMQDNPLAMGHG